MFCKNCGARLDDDALFCAECGARQEAVQPAPAAPSAPAEAPKKKGFKKFLPLVIIGAVFLVTAVVLIAVFAGGSSPTRVAKAYLQEGLKLYTTGADVRKVVKLSYPDEALEVLVGMQSIYYSNVNSVSDYLDMVQELYDELTETNREKYGEYNLRFSIISSTESDLSKAELDEINEAAEEMGFKVTGAKKVLFMVEVKTNNGSQIVTAEVTAYKAGGKWYANAADTDKIERAISKLTGVD